jgi:pimeloyl-ACP methyl ester carboxylesterase
MTRSEPATQIEIDGRRLAWRSVGRGPRLLLINGYAATSEDWDPGFLMRLARSFEVICPDNRGVGASQLGLSEVSIDYMAADLELLLDALELDRVPIVGWSMGGFVAQRLAVRSPDRVAAMALLASDPGGSDSILADPTIWLRLTDHSGTPRDQASRLISLLFPPQRAPEIDRQFGDVVATARAALSAEALIAQEGAMLAWHSSEQPRPGEPPPPTLVVHGSADVVIPAANADPLAARWPGRQAELFDDCGHAFFAQEPQRAASLIGSFCAG